MATQLDPDLTTLAIVKAAAGKTLADDDAKLQPIISGVSQAALNFMNREALSKSRTVDLNVTFGQCSFWLKATPISSVASVIHDTAREFPADKALDPKAYTVDPESMALVLDHRRTPGTGVLRVTYTGGWGQDVAQAQGNGFHDVVQAITQQVLFEFRRNPTRAVAQSSDPGGTTNWMAAPDWQPDVLRILRFHRRHRL